MPRHCYNPKTKHHQITRTSFNDSTMAWQKSPQGNQWFIMLGPSLGCSYNDFTFWVGSTVGVTWICWSCCGVVMKHLNRFRMCLDWKISGSHRCRINIVVSIRYNSNLKIFNTSNSPPILQPKNRVYHDRIPTLNHLVNTELLEERHPARSPLLVPSHSKPSMMTVDTARWWQGKVGCFWSQVM